MAYLKKVEDNTDKILTELQQAISNALDIIGMKAEKYAKARCPVGTEESTGIKGYRGGTLKNSITYEVDLNTEGESTVAIGTNVEYAPYVELGTGPYFEAPPEWENFEAEQGSGIGGGYVHARPYLRPAIEDHISDYESVIKGELGM